MDIKNKTIWQHAAGDWGHNHVDLCLKYDVILTGQEKSINIFKNEDEMQKGDIVVLKLGRSTVYGVGVVGQYEHLEVFDDMDGWWLGHTRRVQWLCREQHDFPGKPLVVATTAGLYNPDVIQWLDGLKLAVGEHEYLHADLPRGDKITSDAIATYLFNKGIASDSIRNLLDPSGDFLQIAKWYDGWDWNDRPSEHETVSHLVVPLLRILGWTPQRMALEWNRIDITLFSRLPRNNDDLTVVLEAKKVREPCLSWAKEQAMEYVKNKEHPLVNCLRVIVTDGLRYGVFTRNNNEEFKLYAYLNLINPRTKYAIYDCYAGRDGCKGAQEAIFAMTPEWQPDQ